MQAFGKHRFNSKRFPFGWILFTLIIVALGAVLYLSVIGVSGNNLTEAEITNIDTMRSRMQQAPRGTIVIGTNAQEETFIGSVSWVENGLFRVAYLGNLSYPRRLSHDAAFRGMKKIIYPNEAGWDSLSARLAMQDY